MSRPLAIQPLRPWAGGHDRLELRQKRDIAGIVVHRIEVSQEDLSYGDSPQDIVRFFREHPIGVGATGGEVPYPLLIEADGQTTQTMPLCCTAPHAVSHNPTTVGVACVGDFRGRAPTAPQRRSLIAVCASLLAELGLRADSLKGHDELTGGSRDPDKQCPGKLLPMDELRADVAAALLGNAEPLVFAW